MSVETPEQERERRIRAKRERRMQRMTPKEREAHGQRLKARKLGERKPTSVIWLDPPIPIKPGSGLMVVGVCASAPRELKRQYGIAA